MAGVKRQLYVGNISAQAAAVLYADAMLNTLCLKLLITGAYLCIAQL